MLVVGVMCLRLRVRVVFGIVDLVPWLCVGCCFGCLMCVAPRSLWCVAQCLLCVCCCLLLVVSAAGALHTAIVSFQVRGDCV